MTHDEYNDAVTDRATRMWGANRDKLEKEAHRIRTDSDFRFYKTIKGMWAFHISATTYYLEAMMWHSAKRELRELYLKLIGAEMFIPHEHYHESYRLRRMVGEAIQDLENFINEPH